MRSGYSRSGIEVDAEYKITFSLAKAYQTVFEINYSIRAIFRTAEMKNTVIHFDNANEASDLGCLLKDPLKQVEQELGVQLVLRDCTATIMGSPEPAERLTRFLQQLREARCRAPLDAQTVSYACSALVRGEEDTFQQLAGTCVAVGPSKPDIHPKTSGQRLYLNALQKNTMTFGIGPAGTGKTYLAMATAVSALLREEVSRIILTRPAIEAGENLGFLPGDFHQKVAPYLRPLHDALHDMLPGEMIEKKIDRGIIDVAPLAYMRGRTLNHAFVILDEAQNTTPQQMLMFLTRLGYGSKGAVTGDPTQIDLPGCTTSGLLEARSIIGDIPGLEIVELTPYDVVRHPLVQCIIEAYQKERTAST